MSKDSIRLDPKHGVNPAIPLCFLCNEPKNEVILAGYMGGKEAPKNVVWDKVPCDKCKKLMRKGVILISMDEAKSKGKEDNPYRTGGWVTVTDDFITRVFTPETATAILARRVAFMSDEVWDKLGMPRGPVEGVPSELPDDE